MQTNAINIAHDFSIISFDWIHRSGKWTQIALLKEYCKKNDILAYALRGEYYRLWSWTDPIEDPYSPWRQEHKYAKCYDTKSQRLNRELRYILERKIPAITKWMHKKTLIILDRSIIGRILFNNLNPDRHKDISSLYEFRYGKASKDVAKTVIPDLMVVFKPSQDELKRRLFSSVELDASYEELLNSYKYDMIVNHYDRFYEWLNLVPDELGKNLMLLQHENSPRAIHESILERLVRQWVL